MARLLFLGASVSQVPAMRHAKARGDVVVACDGDPNAVGFGLCDVAEVVSFSDVDAVEEIAVRHRVEGVLAVCTDRAVSPAAELTRRLGLPGIPPAVARAMSHKPTMRSRLRGHGLPQPQHVVVAGSDEAEHVLSTWSHYPAVVKPADSGGQRGLSLVWRRGELRTAIGDAWTLSRSGEAMVEAYVDGLELNLLFALRAGEPSLLIASDRLRPPGAGFGVGWIHSYPSSLEPNELEAVEQTAAAAIAALGLEDGIAFPQMIWNGTDAVVVEVAARIAAGQMADLVHHATGIQIYEIAIRQALGQPVPDELLEPRQARPVAIRFLTAAPGLLPVGRVTAIRGLDDVRASPGVLDCGLYFGLGTTIEPLRVDADRRGYVIATAPSASEALRRADDAARLLDVETDDPLHAGRPRARRDRSYALAPVVSVLLLVLTVGGFLVSERAKLQQALVAGTRVDKTFSPTCTCAQRVAHITLRVLRRTRVQVGIVDTHGRLVTTLANLPSAPARLVRATWNGRTAAGRLARAGLYYPEVTLDALHRRLVLPSPITVDTYRPEIISARAVLRRRLLVVRYRVSEHAHMMLLVRGRRAVFTRFEPTRGTVTYSEPAAPRRTADLPVALIAIDLAGNRSPARYVRVRRAPAARLDR